MQLKYFLSRLDMATLSWWTKLKAILKKKLHFRYFRSGVIIFAGIFEMFCYITGYKTYFLQFCLMSKVIYTPYKLFFYKLYIRNNSDRFELLAKVAEH